MILFSSGLVWQFGIKAMTYGKIIVMNAKSGNYPLFQVFLKKSEYPLIFIGPA